MRRIELKRKSTHGTGIEAIVKSCAQRASVVCRSSNDSERNPVHLCESLDDWRLRHTRQIRIIRRAGLTDNRLAPVRIPTAVETVSIEQIALGLFPLGYDESL